MVDAGDEFAPEQDEEATGEAMSDEQLAAWAGMDEDFDDEIPTGAPGAYDEYGNVLTEDNYGEYCATCGPMADEGEAMSDEQLAAWAGMEEDFDDETLTDAPGAYDEYGDELTVYEGDEYCTNCDPMADDAWMGMSEEQEAWFWQGVLNGWFDGLTDGFVGPGEPHDAPYDPDFYSGTDIIPLQSSN